MVLHWAYVLLLRASDKISYDSEIYLDGVGFFQIQVYNEKSIEFKKERTHQTH